jgi:hypothetical protein
LSFNSIIILIFQGSLLNTLESCVDGKAILSEYKQKGALDHNSRKRLCKIIISKELEEEPDNRISSDLFMKLSWEIKKIFPTEFTTTYYIPYVRAAPHTVKQATGKLVDAFYNRRRYLMKTGLIEGRTRSRSQTPTSSGSCTPPTAPVSPCADDTG